MQRLLTNDAEHTNYLLRIAKWFAIARYNGIILNRLTRQNTKPKNTFIINIAAWCNAIATTNVTKIAVAPVFLAAVRLTVEFEAGPWISTISFKNFEVAEVPSRRASKH